MASLLYLLSGRMANQLRNENHPATGAPVPQNQTPYTAQEFWEEAVGVVTPHRAQQGLIVSRLQTVFQATGQLADSIRMANTIYRRLEVN